MKTAYYRKIIKNLQERQKNLHESRKQHKNFPRLIDEDRNVDMGAYN